MEEMKDFFVRHRKRDLPDDLVLTLYEKVLLLCESSEFETSSFNVSRIKAFLDTHNVKLTHFFYKPKKAKPTWIKQSRNSKRGKEFVIDSQKIDTVNLQDEIYFVSKSNILKNFLKHVRNAFAHNLIVSDRNNYIVGDFSKSPKDAFSKPTMLGKIEKGKFADLISEILRTETKK